MKMSKFAEKFEMDEDEMIELLTDNGYLKKNGDPTKKGEDYLDDDENVTDSRGLQKIVGDILDDEDETDDDDEDETDDDSDDSNEDDEDSDEDEDNDEEDEEIDYETIKNTIEDFEFSKDEKVDLAKLLIDKLAEDTDADDDEEDNDDEEDDPNAPGTYKGWKISREGIKIVAKNGKKSLTTSVKGNIRKLIDVEMKKKK